MGYGIYFAYEDDPFYENAEHREITYNVRDLFARALQVSSLCDLHGRRAGDVVDQIQRAVEHIINPAHESEYQSLEPSSGFGRREEVEVILRWMWRTALEHPLAILDIS